MNMGNLNQLLAGMGGGGVGGPKADTT